MALTGITKGRAIWTTFKLKVAGAVSRRLYDKLLDTGVDVKDFGALPYPADNTQAFKAALAYAGLPDNNVSIVRASGKHILSERLEIPRGVTLQGNGIDYWDTWRPDEARLIKRMDKGTHLLFTGIGMKDLSCINLENTKTPKVVDTVTHEFTHFTNQDAANGAPATAKLFSAAVILQENSQIKDLRIVPEHDGIDGYNVFTGTELGSNWDVGVWARGANEAVVENVQAVGYWRMAGFLVTENDGTFEQKGNNPERLRVSNCQFQGIRGLLVRNGAQHEVVANTNTTIDIVYNNTSTLTSQNTFRILGNSTYYTFTSYSIQSGNLRLEGVSPDLPANVGILRSPSMGNNLNGTIFTNCQIGAFEHSSKVTSQSLGLPVAAAVEIDGFPLRGLKFLNSKFQSVWDSGNTLFGDCRDLQMVLGQFEGGSVIAYDSSQAPVSTTENLRFISTQVAPHNIDGFTPRDHFDDMKLCPTQFTDSSTRIRPVLPDGDFIIQDYEGNDLERYRLSDGYIRRYGYDGVNYMTYNGTNSSLEFRSDGAVWKRESDGAKFFEFFSGSGNGTCLANWTVGGTLNVTNNILPQTDNNTDIGRATEGIKYIYMHDQTTGVPRRVSLVNGVLTVL